MKVKVTTVDAELEFETSNKTRANELFKQVSRNLGLHEHWFFGLLHVEPNNNDMWIDTSKKSVTFYKAIMDKLKYRVKYYPEDIEELIEEITIRYFYLQVRSFILADRIYCPADTCVLLASYSTQARHGDYDPNIHKKGFLSMEKLLPLRVLEQHKMDDTAWEESIMNMWKKHRGMAKEEAMVEYLKITINLEMFGVHYFDISNQKGSKLYLGVTALGLNVYKPDDKLNASIQFPWVEIKKINFRGTKFSISLTDKGAKPFIFYSKDPIINKRILKLGVGYHSLYVSRRKPDSLELIRMKTKAKERKQVLEEQRKRLQAELHAREEAEQREKSYLEQIASMKKELSKSRQNLLDAEMIIQKLRDQLEELRKSKEQLQEQQNELREMLIRLENAKNAEQAEREKLEEEIRMKQLEVLKAQEEVSKKDEEARRLQEAVEEAKRHEEELKRQREEERQLEEERLRQALLEEQRLAELKAIQEKEKDINASNEELKKQLKELQSKLDESRDESKDTQNDKIHRQNVAEGRDKYQTLAKIRKGNTTRRVDLFENL